MCIPREVYLPGVREQLVLSDVRQVLVQELRRLRPAFFRKRVACTDAVILPPNTSTPGNSLIAALATTHTSLPVFDAVIMAWPG